MRHGDLFSGIGGFSLAAQRCGIKTVWHSEIDEYASKVLQKHWPGVPNHGDITQIDGAEVEPVDIVTAGFPCQAISRAGRREGTKSDKWMWPETIRIIRALRPRWVVLENSPSLCVRGLGDVLGDLAASGFDAEWHVLQATFTGANHPRARVWVVAYPGCGRYRSPKKAIFTGRAGSQLRHWWADEPQVCRVDDGVPNGVDRRRGLGNAIVPQIAEFIFRRILEVEAAS